MDNNLMKKAMAQVIADMGKAAKGAKAKKLQRKPVAPPPPVDEVQVSEVEGGPNLLGLMSKKGNSGQEIADESHISAEELEEILRGAK